MMTLIIPYSSNDRSMAYLIDKMSLVKCNGSTQNERNLLELNFRNLQPVKNAHGSLVVMHEDSWRKYAKVMNATFCKESSDLIFWSPPGFNS